VGDTKARCGRVASVYNEGVETVVRTADVDSEGFAVKVGLHQGSVLSPLLFIIGPSCGCGCGD
jgi:hypothetical protein